VLFRSAAALGGRVIGLVLSGAGSDGAAGLAAIAAAGGTAIVQDPADAAYASMPEHALEGVPAAMVRPVVDIGPLLGELVKRLDTRGVK